VLKKLLIAAVILGFVSLSAAFAQGTGPAAPKAVPPTAPAAAAGGCADCGAAGAAVSKPSGYGGHPVPGSGPSENGRHINSTRQPRLMPVVWHVDTVPEVGFHVVKGK
jgi:hypothetical protein